MKRILILIAVIVFSGIGFAAVDTAVLATDLTNVDAMVASAVAGREGMPVFITENGALNDDIRNELKSSDIKTVVVVGGPLVVKQEAEDELKTGYKVIRLWGIERTQTAIEVAKYFWNTECAVLVGDTKNDEADAKLQLHASNLASRFGCVLVPVPNGTVPAEVLKTLDELNITHVKFVGRINDEIRKSVKKFILEEFKDENEIEKSILNATRKPKIVIVATPDWKATVAIGAEPHNNSVVKMVSDAGNETIQKLVALIRNNNITDVRVVGMPILAQEIAAKLQSEGINVTKISGSKAGEIAKEAWKKNKEKWLEIRNKAKQRDDAIKEKTKAMLERRLNDTESELDEQEAELDELGLQADVTAIKQMIAEANSRIVGIRQKISDGSLEEAKIMIEELKNFRLKKWLEREKIKWDWRRELKDEEGNNSGIERDYREKLGELQNMLADYRKACNATAIESLTEKAKSLLDEAKNETASGNYTKAAKLLTEVKSLVKTAKSIGEVCRKEKKVEGRLEKIADKRTEKAEELRKKVTERIERIKEKD